MWDSGFQGQGYRSIIQGCGRGGEHLPAEEFYVEVWESKEKDNDG